MTPTQVRRLRKSLNEKPHEFARRFGVARTTILSWERKGTPKIGAGRHHIETVLAELEAFEREPVK